MPITIPTPNMRFKRDSFHGGKFFAVIALAITCAVAGAQGWVPIPNASAFGLIALLLLLAVVFIAVNTQRVWLRNFAVAVALVVGVVIGSQWGPVWKTIIGFGWL